jgi:DNA mismatch endonuclease (patch repair protein)
LSEGWRILVVWECALKGPGKRPLTEISSEIAGWLETDYKRMEIKGETEEK